MVVGTVPYLNAVPLTWALHRIGFRGTLVYGEPVQLSQWLERGVVDVGLVPIAEYLRGVGNGIVEGIAIASDGAVRSVLLVSKVPPFQLETVAVDKGSRSSVLLLKILLTEVYGVSPILLPMEPQLDLMLERADAALLIGDHALKAQPLPRWQVLDLGQEWKAMTGLPFVFATWVTRNEVNETELASWLAQAKAEGLKRLKEIVHEEAQKRSLDRTTVHHYLTPVHLDSIHLFNRLCVRHGLLPALRTVRLVRCIGHRA